MPCNEMTYEQVTSKVIDNTQGRQKLHICGHGVDFVQDECRVHYGNKKHLGPTWIASGTTFPDVK